MFIIKYSYLDESCPDNNLCALLSISGWTIGGTVNLPSSPAIHLVYNTRTTISGPGDLVERSTMADESSASLARITTT